jgi:hypothetical protein
MSRIGQSRIHSISRARTRPRRSSGLGSGTLVLTLAGELPVEHLAAGDRIVTRAGARTLRRITSHKARNAWIVAPHVVDEAQPEGTITVGPAQEMLVRDWRARALCGRDSATLPVARLADGAYISASATPVRLWRLEFDGEEVIYAGGLELTVPAPEITGI